jgi:hypothetical protein
MKSGPPGATVNVTCERRKSLFLVVAATTPEGRETVVPVRARETIPRKNTTARKVKVFQ